MEYIICDNCEEEIRGEPHYIYTAKLNLCNDCFQDYKIEYEKAYDGDN